MSSLLSTVVCRQGTGTLTDLLAIFEVLGSFHHLVYGGFRHKSLFDLYTSNQKIRNLRTGLSGEEDNGNSGCLLDCD